MLQTVLALLFALVAVSILVWMEFTPRTMKIVLKNFLGITPLVEKECIDYLAKKLSTIFICTLLFVALAFFMGTAEITTTDQAFSYKMSLVLLLAVCITIGITPVKKLKMKLIARSK